MYVTLFPVVKSFKHKGLAELLRRGRPTKINATIVRQCLLIVDALQAAESLKDLNAPGFGLHRLQGQPTRRAVKVNKNWRITFEWKQGDAHEVHLEDYH